MPSASRWLSRLVTLVLALTLFASASPPSADAATKLFIVAGDLGELWRVDPVTGKKISGFAVPSISSRPGLGFDGTFLYYTDETLAEVRVYTEAGVLDRTLPKPAGTEAGSGIGATKTSVFLVGLDNVINELNPTTGAVLNTFTIPGASQGLAFAGALNRLLVVVHESTTIKKITLAGADDGSIVVPELFRGLAFSSSSSTIFGTRGGFLWATDTSGNLLPGYPVQIHDDVTNVTPLKTGAAAADEPVLEECGDGQVNADGETCDPPGAPQTNGATCRADCTYCGDGTTDTSEQCDDGNTVNTDDCRNDCTLPRCGDGVKDPNEECDDGNLIDEDGCSATCSVEPFCGDGTIDPELGEQCDPPNTPGCDANCHATEICTDQVDNDGDGQIDCLDDDCDCLPIGRDPGAIRFGRPGTGDQFAVHGSLDPTTQLSPGSEDIKFLLTNTNGAVEIYKVTIPAGAVKQIGRNLFRYKNKLAQRNRDGVARFDLRYFPKKDIFTFALKTYGDLSKATVADMEVQLAIGADDAFLNKSTWGKTPKGWILTLPGEH